MNKKKYLRLLLRHPLSVLKEGLKMVEKNAYKKDVKAAHQMEQLPTIDLLDLFPEMHEHITSYSFLTGTSLITDLILLKCLAKRFDQCAYLEIGSWRGESLVNLASVTDDCTSVTLSPAEMRALDLGEDFIKVHGIFSNSIKSITKIEENSFTFDFSKLGKHFDLIFVDGDHSYEGILNDTQKVFPLRRDDHSVIVWHDYGYHTEDVRHSTLKAILDAVPKEKHHHLYHVSNTLCAVYIENIDLPTRNTLFPSYPNKTFSLEVTAKRWISPSGE